MCIVIAVYGTARIGLHRKISDELLERNEWRPISFAMKLFSGMLSGAIAVCIGTPFDVALVRMQSDSMRAVAERRNYKNVFDALKRIVREEGAGKLYSGLLPNVLRGMSMNAGMLACYDQVMISLGLFMRLFTFIDNVILRFFLLHNTLLFTIRPNK